MRPLLKDYVSRNEGQIFRCPSQHPARTWAPPFAVAFSHGQSLRRRLLLSSSLTLCPIAAAKAGGRQTLVIGDEEGMLNFIDTERENQWDQGELPPSLAHPSATDASRDHQTNRTPPSKDIRTPSLTSRGRRTTSSSCAEFARNVLSAR